MIKLFKKYKLGAIIGGLYGSIGSFLLVIGLFFQDFHIFSLVIGFPALGTLRIIQDILIKVDLLSDWTFIVTYLINTILWVFIGMYIQKVGAYIRESIRKFKHKK